LFASNRAWVHCDIEQRTPGFFSRLQKQQSPENRWIGCSDSRVPANEVCGLLRRQCRLERFPHRVGRQLVAPRQRCAQCESGVYGLHNELINDLPMTIASSDQVQAVFAQALARLQHRYKQP
jgi:hypothetical protein